MRMLKKNLKTLRLKITKHNRIMKNQLLMIKKLAEIKIMLKLTKK